MNSTIIFNKTCFSYNNYTIIYCLAENLHSNINIKNIFYSNFDQKIKVNINLTKNMNIIKNKKSKNIFILKIKGKMTYFNKKFIDIIYSDNTKSTNIQLFFPFQSFIKQLPPNAVIIANMCKGNNDRLTEWMKYNFKLGFDAIIIFNNGNIIENEYFKNNSNKILIIDFPYKTFPNTHWNNIQGMSFCIATNTFKFCTRFIALIDCDEFIYIPNNNNIKSFLSNYKKSIIMKSNLMTNKEHNYKFNNNLLKTSIYVGHDRYKKIIVYSKNIIFNKNFISNPHISFDSNCINLDKDIIIHYHLWVNKRLNYDINMPKFEELSKFLYS